MKEKDKVIFAKLILKITFIMMCISIGLKLSGLNFFEADHSNQILLFISNILEKYHLDTFLDFLLLIIQNFIFFRLACQNKNLKVYYTAAFLTTLITLLFQYVFFSILNLQNSQTIMFIYYIFTFLLLMSYPIFIDIKIKSEIKIKNSFMINILMKLWNKIKKPIVLLIILSIYQQVVMFLRNLTYVARWDYLYNFLLNFDYTILLLVTYYLFLKKENDVKLKSAFEFSIFKFLKKRPSIKDIRTMISKIKKAFKKFKEMEKSEKIVIVVYIFFAILSDLFNFGIIVLVAFLNHGLIELLFIVTSFLISKQVFGAFHLDSAIKCWLVSNVSFFVLTTITPNVTTTFIIPIICGIFLAYITSKLIKKTNKELYRGISEKDLLKICEEKNLTKFELNLLIDFYCKRENLVKLTHKYNYSQSSICEFKAQALRKIEV